MKKRIFTVIISLFSFNCFLLPPSASFNNPTDSPLTFLVPALESISASLSASATNSFIPSVSEATIAEGEFLDMKVRFSKSITSSKIVTISSRSSLIVPEPGTLTFEVGQGTVDQTFRLNSLIDSNSDSETVIVSFSADGVETANITITHSENTSSLLTVTGTIPTIIVEGTTATFSLNLKLAPTEDITVILSSSNTASMTVSPATLTFTTTDYNTPQTVTLTGVEDANQVGEKITLTMTASGVATTNEIIVFDNDTGPGTLGLVKTGRTVDGGKYDRTFTDLGNGIILDNATRLFWKKCQRGYTGTNCDEVVVGGTNLTWFEANSYCSSLTDNGFTWRMPTINELLTLSNAAEMDFDITNNNALFNSIFPRPVATIQGGLYWSSNDYAPDNSYAWGIGINGKNTAWVKGDNIAPNVHCVSGTTESSQSFLDNSDGTIKDNNTGLIWQKCSFGQSGNDCSGGVATQLDWTTAKGLCAGSTLGGKTARLPNRNELQSIIDYTQTSPVINGTFFPNTLFGTTDYYWTSTIYKIVPNPNTGFGIPDNTNVFTISFKDGQLNTLGDLSLDGNNFPTGNNQAYIRCVAGP